MKPLTDNQLEDLADALEGTCDSIDSVLDRWDVDADVSDVEDQLLDVNMERCPVCDWWFESCWLDNDGGVCPDCEEDDEDH